MVKRWTALCIALLLALLVPARVAAAQADEVRVEVRVTSVAGSSFYVDRGRGDGIEPEDRVSILLDGGTYATGIVRSVSLNSARAEAEPGSPVPPVGARGEVRVPRARAPAGAGQRADPDAPRVEHAPWTHPPESWNRDHPLLAPAFGIPPEERERRMYGRAWTRFSGTWDAESDRDHQLFTLGADWTMENPFGDGGAVHVGLEAFQRERSDDGGFGADDDSRLRLDRLSYEFGGTEDRPNRFEFGRFFQREFPELGRLDGAEWSRRAAGGSRFGASFGWMPEPYADLGSFQDLQASVFYRHAFDEAERNTLGGAYQNTWHDGEQDRNLFVLQAEVRPGDSLSVRATTWVDLYTSDDVIKGSGAELTEAQVSATWRAQGGDGLGLFASHRVFPELLRDEFTPVSRDQLEDGFLDRIGVHAWTNAGPRTRYSARFDVWRDDEDQGTTAELGAARRDAFGAGSDLSGAVQWADGTFSSGPGARLWASIPFGSARAGLGARSYWYEQKDYGGSDDRILQHSVHGSLDIPIGDSISLSILGDRSFGDGLDSWTVGLMLQTRF